MPKITDRFTYRKYCKHEQYQQATDYADFCNSFPCPHKKYEVQTAYRHYLFLRSTVPD